MNDPKINMGEWEARRRLSFAMAMRSETPVTLAGIWRAIKQASHTLTSIALASANGRTIELALLILGLSLNAGVWITQSTADANPEQHSVSSPTHTVSAQIASVHPDLSATMTFAASVF